MPVVPIHRGSRGQPAPATTPSLDPQFAQMAAAQIHSEGRLVAPGGSGAKIASIPEPAAPPPS